MGHHHQAGPRTNFAAQASASRMIQPGRNQRGALRGWRWIKRTPAQAIVPIQAMVSGTVRGFQRRESGHRPSSKAAQARVMPVEGAGRPVRNFQRLGGSPPRASQKRFQAA